MNLALVLKSLQFYDLKEKSTLRLIFILLFGLRLAQNLFQLRFVDFISLLNYYLDAGSNISIAELYAEITPGHIYYVLAGLAGFIIQFFFLYLYASVLVKELQVKLADPMSLQLELQENPRSFVSVVAKLRAFVLLFRKRQAMSLEIPRVLEQASNLARAAGRKAISETDIREAEDLLNNESAEGSASGAEKQQWIGPGAVKISSEEGEIHPANPDSYLLDYDKSSETGLWGKCFKLILSKFPQLILLILIAIPIFILCIPFLSLPFFVIATAFAYAPLNLILNDDSFAQALKRSRYAQKGFKMMLFSAFVVLRMCTNIPYYFASSLFFDSPYSLAIVESLCFVLLTLTGGRLMGIMYATVAFKPELKRGVSNA
ncbi:MAG: hypothetical protein Q4P08_03365 [Eubacteriales bacterium]|nr:hypothetical protein [Eubacteriales bacterium]